MGLLVGHGSCIMGHGSLSAWVTGSWVNASDPLPALATGWRLERSAAKCCRRCSQRVEKASVGVCWREGRTFRTSDAGCFDNWMKLLIDSSCAMFWRFDPTPEICQGQPPTMCSECSRFHPNRFTFSKVIAERVNIAKLPRRVNPIFGRSLARAEKWQKVRLNPYVKTEHKRLQPSILRRFQPSP